MNVVTKAPDFLLPVRLGELYGLMLSPKHTIAVGKEAIATKPNGTGPFKLVTWSKNDQLVLEANDSYWRGAPKVKKIAVRPILEDAARIAALQTGEVDLISPIPHVRIEELKRNDKLVIKTIAAPAHLSRHHRRAQAAVRQRQGAPGAELRGRRQRDREEPLLRPRHPAGHRGGQGRAGLRPGRPALPVRPGQGQGAAGRGRLSRTASRSSSTASPAASPITPSRPRPSSATSRRSGSRPS